MLLKIACTGMHLQQGFISIHFQVQELIYHLELARGCYKGNAAGLARYSMLRKRNVVKFVKDSSILRPGYYIGIDPRAKLVILGIRGTHTVYDLVTDLIALSDKKVSPKGFSTHFGTYEAARWYLRHELGIIRKCLEKHKVRRYTYLCSIDSVICFILCSFS